MLFLSQLWTEGAQQLAGICGLLGARSHQTEGNPAGYSRALAATGEQAVWGSRGVRAVTAKAPGSMSLLGCLSRGLPPQPQAPMALFLLRRCRIQ